MYKEVYMSILARFGLWANKSTLLAGGMSPVICDACSFAPRKISANKTKTNEENYST